MEGSPRHHFFCGFSPLASLRTLTLTYQGGKSLKEVSLTPGGVGGGAGGRQSGKQGWGKRVGLRAKGRPTDPRPILWGRGSLGPGYGLTLPLSVVVGVGFPPSVSVWVLLSGSDCSPHRPGFVWVPSPAVCACLWLSGLGLCVSGPVHLISPLCLSACPLHVWGWPLVKGGL